MARFGGGDGGGWWLLPLLHMAEQDVDAFGASGVDELFGFFVPFATALRGGAFEIRDGFVDCVVEHVLLEVVGVNGVVKLT